MKTIHIIVGSQMGSAEYTADQIHQELNAINIANELHEFPDPTMIPSENVIWLICTSTHGAGDLPDNLQEFAAYITGVNSLSEIEYGIIGLGDRSYDTFNLACKTIDELLALKGAKRIGQRLEIDVLDEQLPEDSALAWLPTWLKQI